MSTAAISRAVTNLGKELDACEVRVWGMDVDDKPFIQTATARHITEKGALLTGVFPVNMGDVIGLRYLERKARFKITWVSDPDRAQTRSVGVDCVEDINFFGVRRQPIPIEPTSKLYSESVARTGGQLPMNRRQARRYQCHVAVDVRQENVLGLSHASVTDISSKGCYLQMIAPLVVDSAVSLEIYATNLSLGKPLVLRGVVRTCHPMVGMGVEFTNVSEADLRGIEIVLEQLAGKSGVKTETHSAARTSTPAVEPAEAFPMAIEIPSARAMAMQICSELQKLEIEAHRLSDKKLTAELRQAALHMKNVAHMCPAG